MKMADGMRSVVKARLPPCRCPPCFGMIADFEYDNEDAIQSALQSYSINGVSMAFGDAWNVKIQNGVAIRRDTYSKLLQTGLCSLTVGR